MEKIDNQFDGLDELDEELLMAQMEGMSIEKPGNGPPEEKPVPQEGDARTIQRIGNFDISLVEDKEAGKQWKTIDDGYLTIKEKMGEGSFCKVKKAVALVHREEVNEETGEKTLVPGT